MAAPDLRERLQRWISINGDSQRSWEERLLALDPLTTLRCMRVAHSQVYGLPRELMTIPQLCEALGSTMVRHALNTRTCDVAGTEPVRRLWLHSIATAQAARSLARSSGEYDPDKAYVLGLLHDLPLWLHQSSRQRDGANSSISATEWMKHWRLPPSLQAVAEQVTPGSRQHPPIDSADPVSLVTAAELLAEVGDFWHPHNGDQLPRDMLSSVVTANDLVAAHNLRQQVTRSLEGVGLEAATLEAAQAPTTVRDDQRLFAMTGRGDMGDLVRSMVDCQGSADPRGIISATTSAALRYLGFERAYTVKWSPGRHQCYVRAKADLSPRPLRQTVVNIEAKEHALFECAQKLRTAQHLVADGRPGLMSFLGADEALVVSIDRGRSTPSFLVMDRMLSGTPIRLQQDRPGAEALAGTAMLLTESLLLNRQMKRAQKYALTDSLTRLFNRGVGINSLATELARAKRTGEPLTILMLDMDDFKALNDTHGHVKGDQALRSTADVLRRTMRKADVICRYGGEEFLAVLPGTSVEDASILATRIFTAVAQAGDTLGLPLTISIGLSAVHPHDDDVESALTRADRALYASKARGRNRFSVDED